MAKKETPKIEAESKPFNSINNLLDKFSAYKKFRSSKNFYIVIAVVALLLLVVYKKSWFISATVNGSPISNIELQMRLNQNFRAKTLDQLVNEKILLNEAAKNNIGVSQSDVDQKITEIEKSFGGAAALDAMLSQQGLNRESIKPQVKIQLIKEKLYSKDATVSAEEVAQYIEQNKDQLRATDSATQQKEVYDGLKNDKLSQIFNQKFQELRQKAKIQIF